MIHSSSYFGFKAKRPTYSKTWKVKGRSPCRMGQPCRSSLTTSDTVKQTLTQDAAVSLLGVYTSENCVSSSETLTRLDPFVGSQVSSSRARLKATAARVLFLSALSPLPPEVGGKSVAGEKEIANHGASCSYSPFRFNTLRF